MAIGDHFMVSYGVYTHHGICVGDGRVAHYGGFLAGTNEGRVEVVDDTTFAQGRPILSVDSPARFTPREIARRALSRVGEERYSLWANNCEHFVHWCRSGDDHSRQISRVLERFGSGATKLAARKLVARAARRGTSASTRGATRVATPWLLLADVLQLSTEVAVSGSGASDEQATGAGQAVGFGASVGIGLAVAGPGGAAAGAGLWAVGEGVGKLGSHAATRCCRLLD